MGPDVETFLTVLVPILLVGGLAFYATRDQRKRVVRYIKAWRSQDELIELEDRLCRQDALREVEHLSGTEEIQQTHGKTKI